MRTLYRAWSWLRGLLSPTRLARAANPDDVWIGHGRLYIGPKDEAAPGIDTAPAGNWVDAGEFHEDGLSFEDDENVVFVRSGQSKHPLKAFLQSRDTRINTALVESSLESINYAFGGADGDVTTDAGPPATEKWVPSGTKTERALLFRVTGGANNGKNRQIYVPRSVANGGITLPFGPTGTLVPCQFTILENVGGDPFDIVDAT